MASMPPNKYYSSRYWAGMTAPLQTCRWCRVLKEKWPDTEMTVLRKIEVLQRGGRSEDADLWPIGLEQWVNARVGGQIIRSEFEAEIRRLRTVKAGTALDALGSVPEEKSGAAYASDEDDFERHWEESGGSPGLPLRLSRPQISMRPVQTWEGRRLPLKRTMRLDRRPASTRRWSVGGGHQCQYAIAGTGGHRQTGTPASRRRNSHHVAQRHAGEGKDRFGSWGYPYPWMRPWR